MHNERKGDVQKALHFLDIYVSNNKISLKSCAPAVVTINCHYPRRKGAVQNDFWTAPFLLYISVEHA